MRLATVFRSLVLLALTSCCSLAIAASPIDALNHARTLIVVTTADWDSTQARLRTFTRVDGEWQPAAQSFAVALGRQGSAWGEGLHPVQMQGPQKREGDGRSPAGVFAIGPAFGYASKIDSAMPYQAMSATHYCMDVPSSPLYNRIVDAHEAGASAVRDSTEPMRRDLHADGDQRYKLGLTIAHNPDNVSGGGSCIFAHLWQAPGVPTAGCTAMAEPAMQDLLQWLQPHAKPVFVLLPAAERTRLAGAWQLPDGR